VVPAAHELTRKTSIEPSKAQKGKQSNNSKNNYLIRLRAPKFKFQIRIGNADNSNPPFINDILWSDRLCEQGPSPWRLIGHDLPRIQ
jgi:hypothetical protein